MANDDHVARLKKGSWFALGRDEDPKLALLKREKGVAAWNAWRDENPDIRPDLFEANLCQEFLIGANLREAYLRGADLSGSNLHGANLIGANLWGANLGGATLSHANLSRADLTEASLCGAGLYGANLTAAMLHGVNLIGSTLDGADLRAAWLHDVNLRAAHLIGANLRGADLQGATLVDTNLTDADLTGCRIYGVSAWSLKLERAKQQNLVITKYDEPTVTVDDIEVAQFVYLLLHNEKIRNVIDTIGKKGVLLLGRFTEGRMVVLERLRDKLTRLRADGLQLRHAV